MRDTFRVVDGAYQRDGLDERTGGSAWHEELLPMLADQVASIAKVPRLWARTAGTGTETSRRRPHGVVRVESSCRENKWKTLLVGCSSESETCLD